MSRLAFGDALVLSPPGIGSIAVREARRVGLRAVELAGDRRADVVGLTRPGGMERELRTAEDVLVVVATLPIRHTAAATAQALDPARVLAALASHHRAMNTRSRRAVRVVVRLADERHFIRTALRAAVERRLGRLHDPRDDADELWIIQTDRRTLHVAVRDRRASRRGSRRIERHGALRPAIAAAMVLCAYSPRRVLDPCCGSGTVVDEAAATGARTFAGDIDAAAVAAAAANTTAALSVLDARRLPYAADAFDAVITNLPFGRQHELQGTPVAWYRRTLAEALRVAPTVVVLVPPTQPFRQALGRTRAELVERHDLVVLGRPATLWSIRRR